jgi:hypothetical protein
VKRERRGITWTATAQAIMHVRFFLACILLCAHAAAAAPRAPDPAHLRAGEFLWHPEVAPEGPVVVIVSLDEQRVYVYRNGVAIGLATISSGRKGYETPPGVFTILQKDRDHRSNRYDDAPMPFMERLTWDGVALHGGALPGYPASHGCVRLPPKFAAQLYAITQRGETVVVANSAVAPAHIVHPALLAPVGTSGAPVDVSVPPESFSWDDSAVPVGPLSVLVSTSDRRVDVLRNGVRIGSTALDVGRGFSLDGTVLFVMGEGFATTASPLDPSRPRHRWSAYPIAGNVTASIDELAGQLRVGEQFARRLYAALTPGTTVLVSDLPSVRATPMQTVLEALTPAR